MKSVTGNGEQLAGIWDWTWVFRYEVRPHQKIQISRTGFIPPPLTPTLRQYTLKLLTFQYPQWPLCTHLAASSWSITFAMSDRNCMKYCITKLWFRFNGKSSSSTLTTAFNKSKNWGTFSLFLATRVIILCTWLPLIFMQVLELPVNTWKSNTEVNEKPCSSSI